jgi:two-component system KDP operon response regulator KdpE
MTPDQTKILIVDDEVQIRRILRLTLESNGFAITEAATGKDGLYEAANGHHDAIILDLGLPDMDGVSVLKQIREWCTVPVIILSVRSEEREKVAALEAGADDYITKPFGTKELIARVRVCLRRTSHPEDEVKGFNSGNLSIDFVNRRVTKDGHEVKLTPTEYSLLMLFAKNEGRVLTHRYITKELWGPYRVDEIQCLRVHMAQLRKKLEPDPSFPKLFVTESGVGYRLQVSDDIVGG